MDETRLLLKRKLTDVFFAVDDDRLLQSLHGALETFLANELRW